MPTVKCDVCDKEITTQNLPRHRKTRLHLLNSRIFSSVAKNVINTPKKKI